MKGGNRMALSTLTSRIEETDKARFISFCDSVGLTSSDAINLFVKAVIREHCIPFEIKAEDPFYSASNQRHLMKSVQQLRDGKGTAYELLEDDNFNMRINRKKKSDLEALYSQLGMTLPEAVNIFFENSLLVGGLPFEVRLPRFNRETEKAMQEARDIMSGKVETKSYSSSRELFDALDSE